MSQYLENHTEEEDYSDASSILNNKVSVCRNYDRYDGASSDEENEVLPLPPSPNDDAKKEEDEESSDANEQDIEGFQNEYVTLEDEEFGSFTGFEKGDDNEKPAGDSSQLQTETQIPKANNTKAIKLKAKKDQQQAPPQQPLTDVRISIPPLSSGTIILTLYIYS